MIGDFGNVVLNTFLNVLGVPLDAVDDGQVLLDLVVHLGHDAGEHHVQGALTRSVLTLELPGAVGELVVLGIAEGIGVNFHDILNQKIL